MSDAISLLSALIAAPVGGQGARAQVPEGFGMLFQQGGSLPQGTGGAGAVPGAAQLRKMYNFLAGLGNKATALARAGDDPSRTMQGVAGLASDLAGALAGFDRETGLGLIAALQVQRSATGTGGDQIPPSGEATQPADPAAAVEALQAVIATVVRVLRELSGAQATTAQGGFGALAGSIAVTSVMEQGSRPQGAPSEDATPQAPRAETVRPADAAPGPVALHAPAEAVAKAVRSAEAAAPATMAAAGRSAGGAGRAMVGAVVQGSEIVAGSRATMATRIIATGPETAPAAPTAAQPGPVSVAAVSAATAPIGADAAVEAGAPVFAIPARPGRGRGEMPEVRVLMGRILEAAAGAVTAPAHSSGTAVAAAVPGLGPVEGVTRRFGPTEPLITPEDVARVMAREAQMGRDPAAAGTTKAAQPAPEQPKFSAALSSQIRAAEVSEGRTRIELSPRGLGVIEVDVSTGQDGALKVVVRAENPSVLNGLRQDRDLLAQALGGMEGGSLDLQSFTDGGARDPRGRAASAMTVPRADDIIEGEPDAAPVRTVQIGEGRLDIVT